MSSTSPTVSKRARIKARRNTVQALYQCFMTDKEFSDIIAEFESDDQKLAKTDVEYFKLLLRGTIKCRDELDAQIEKLLDRSVDDLDAIERAILHIGSYELMYCQEIPWRVVVNEAIELAKLFGAEESHKYINGILDKVAKEIRPAEVN